MARTTQLTEQQEQAIRERAYAIWVEEGYAEGEVKAVEYWYRAEAEILGHTQTPPPQGFHLAPQGAAEL